MYVGMLSLGVVFLNPSMLFVRLVASHGRMGGRGGRRFKTYRTVVCLRWYIWEKMSKMMNNDVGVAVRSMVSLSFILFSLPFGGRFFSNTTAVPMRWYLGFHVGRTCEARSVCVWIQNGCYDSVFCRPLKQHRIKQPFEQLQQQ